jgi:hypothetical protein
MTKNLIITILTFLFSFTLDKKADAQNSNIKSKTEWSKVEIKVMETKDPPKEFKTKGEGAIKIHGPITSVADLNESEIEQLKKHAAKNKCCIVYIDTKGLWDMPKTPTMASRGLLYYYFVKDK